MAKLPPLMGNLFWAPPPNQTKPSSFEFLFVNIGIRRMKEDPLELQQGFNVPVKEKGLASWIPN